MKRHYLIIAAGVGFVIPLVLWLLGLIGLDWWTPPTLLVWPAVVLMAMTIGNEEWSIASMWLLVSAGANALVYVGVCAVVLVLRKRRA